MLLVTCTTRGNQLFHSVYYTYTYVNYSQLHTAVICVRLESTVAISVVFIIMNLLNAVEIENVVKYGVVVIVKFTSVSICIFHHDNCHINLED
jgi:hypothetical protein